ncbi:HNH endonuclease signature motif containing protein [Gordonia zhaorongruii]|uniref:HNH endonuclease signature motif containing protein n=1 Tax=Gordonia zhaorongruii TaxID=2597659 RepID=UPI001051CE8A|nr:HNH endonuclease signature motif containing protein [Gordonia zhaorongruii]
MGGIASVSTSGNELVIRIPLPADDADDASRVAFAGQSERLDGPLRWYRFRSAYQVLTSAIVAADAVSSDPNALYDPVTRTAAEYAAVARVRQSQAEGFLDRAADCFERIPRIGECMRAALITPMMFDDLRFETALIEDPEVLADVDATVADWLRGAGQVSRRRASENARRIVTRLDAEAARQRRKESRHFKDAGASPLDGRLSRFIVTADAEDALLSQEVVDALAAGVCDDDPRSKAQRRSDAAVALLQRRTFTCRCSRPDCPAELSDGQIADRCARIVLHVVARRETLDGSTDTPAYLDGFGPVSADHVRELIERPDAVERDLDVDELLEQTAQDACPYRPTATCDAAVRAAFGRCSWPGCDRPAWKSDLDHVCEYNHRDPAAGGATCFCNLNPKCRFHHGLKTSTDGWLDDQMIDANGIIWTEVTSPTGITVRTEAGNTWLLPELGLLPCRHGPPASPGPSNPRAEPQRSTSRTEAKHRYRMKMRAENRRAREHDHAAPSDRPNTSGDIPF